MGSSNCRCRRPTTTTRTTIPTTGPRRGEVSLTADPLVEVAVRVYADFADRAILADVLAVVARARTDLDTPSAAALPELVERLAR